MASPGDKKGQRRGSCGHVMASFDMHDKCARCRDKLIGEDKCVLKKPCAVCDGFSESQCELLATPTYRIRKDKKAGLLVSPKEVTVISTVDSEPTFQPPSNVSAQPSAQHEDSPPSTMPSSSSAAPTMNYVTSDQLLAISDKWSEQFARMEALLSRDNVFSTPASAVKPIDSQALISKNPFVPPATRPTGPVEVPVAMEDSAKQKKVEEKDKKKKSHKSRKQDKTDSDSKLAKTLVHNPEPKPERRRDRSPSPVRQVSSAKAPHSSPVVASSGPESASQRVLNKGDTSLFPSDLDVSTGNTGAPPASQSGFGQPSAGACAYPPDDHSEYYEQFTDYPMDRSDSGSGSCEEEEGQLSDSNDPPEQTEDMSYRETVRSVRAFMGWHHIPTFETDYTEPDKSNNPWKGKHPNKPTRISVAMPLDDWLCQKLERLNLTVAEGYPSRSQDSAGLKHDQFVKVPKTQSKWYKMHMLKAEGTQRPGRSVCSWRNTEAKVNSQFPRITRAAAYPATGPPCRPISQESLRRWERTAREDSY